MTHGSLFSGIGGFDLAAAWAGWTNVFNCEIDPFCRRVLKYHFPESEQYGDIKTTDFTVWRDRVDVLTGGFPCQPQGTLWVNMGDSYAGSGRGAGDTKRSSQKQRSNAGSWTGDAHKAFKGGEVKPKDLIGIPWMLAFALRADGWYLRQDIIWHKPNPMPESVTDRCTKSHEYIFLFSKSPRYYFDAEAIKEPATGWNGSKFEDDKNLINHPNVGKIRQRKPAGWDTGKGGHGSFHRSGRAEAIEYYEIAPEASTTRNKRSVWTVSPQPFKEAHFATFPENLIVPCILAGCPVGGLVLDPFNGSGTTRIVANKLGRNAIGFELNPKYIEIENRRRAQELGIFETINEYEGL